MKNFGLLILFAAVSLALPSCANDGENGTGDLTGIGKVVYGSKAIAMNAPIFEENCYESTDQRVYSQRWKVPETKNEINPVKTYTVGVTSALETDADPDKATTLCYISSLLYTDFTVNLSSFSNESCLSVCFNSGEKYYYTLPTFVRIFTDQKSRLSSIGIDPGTGYPALPDQEYDYTFVPIWRSLEFDYITGGSLSVKWKNETVRIEFNLKLSDGKTAKGSAIIPYSVFNKSL